MQESADRALDLHESIDDQLNRILFDVHEATAQTRSIDEKSRAQISKAIWDVVDSGEQGIWTIDITSAETIECLATTGQPSILRQLDAI